MPTGTTLASLADEFVAALHEHGLDIDRPSVEQEMGERIADIAERLGVDAAAVLRDHACAGWGRQMALDVIGQIRESTRAA